MRKRDDKISSRVYETNAGRWYFSARRQSVGPFHNADEAERALHRHISDCKVRDSLAFSLSWPRAWTIMRLRRRAQPKHNKQTSFAANS